MEGAVVPVKRHFLLCVAISGILAVVYAGYQRSVENGPYFYDKLSHRVTLQDFKGEVVLVNLWATWCPPCVGELPALARLQGKHADQKFRVVAVSLDNKTSLQDIRAFMDRHGAKTLEVYQDKDRQIQMQWKYEGLPTSFLIGRQGKVVKKYNGVYAWDTEDVLSDESVHDKAQGHDNQQAHDDDKGD